MATLADRGLGEQDRLADCRGTETHADDVTGLTGISG